MKVSLQYASEHLEELVQATDNGEEVEVARDGKPSIKLFLGPTTVRLTGDKRTLGTGRGVFLPSVDDNWQRQKEEDARAFLEAPLMTTGEV